ncbi:MAG TPA: hypothetical protein VI704_05805 [Bacteroidota bacterium]|nr:hypothetical protein [Bacteroidota bacterium]
MFTANNEDRTSRVWESPFLIGEAIGRQERLFAQEISHPEIETTPPRDYLP